MSANTNSWKQEYPGIWVLGPLTIHRQMDERTHVYIYEMYDATRFVQAFSNLAAAMQHAKQLGWSVAV